MISVGRPVAGLEHLGFASAAVQGCYRARLGRLELLLVDVRGLPPVPGTSLLRAFDDREEVAAANLRALFEDPDVQSATKIAVREAMMREPGLWHEGLRDLSGEELISLGEERGFERGVERGRVLTLRSVLTLQLERRLGALPRALAEAIEACADPGLLERAVGAVVSEPDASLTATVTAILTEC